MHVIVLEECSSDSVLLNSAHTYCTKGGGGQLQKNQLSGVREMSSKILAFQNHHFVGTDDEGAAKWWGFCLSKKSPSLS